MQPGGAPVLEANLGGAGCQQLARDRLLSFERHPRHRERHQRGCAAGNHAQQQIPRSALTGDFRNPAGAFDAALIGHRVAGFMQMNPLEFGFGSVGNVNPTAGNALAEQPFEGLRHLGTGLAGADHLNTIEIGQAVAAACDAQDFPARFAIALDVRQHGLNRVGRFQRGVKNI